MIALQCLSPREQQQIGTAKHGPGAGKRLGTIRRTHPRDGSSHFLRNKRKPVRTILLTHGMSAIVDDIDFERIAMFPWRALRKRRETWYAQREEIINGQRMAIIMHRFIMDAPAELFVDHANHDGLDNRRANLRICTLSQNNANRRGWRNGQFRGVYWKSRRQLWEAAIKQDGKYKFLGEFQTAEAAAHAYDLAALSSFGEYATLNFPVAT
jgi:hypothetical protein